jgi:hypothetical protein
MRIIKRLLPVAISLGLLVWLMTWISPHALAQAASELPWRLLLPATITMVLALYFWDAVCLGTVYRVDGHRWGYWRSLHLRGLSYLGGAVNYELGQAGLAWGLARLQQTGLMRMLARSVLLAYHDIVVLLALGLFGSLWSDDPRIEHLRLYLALALAGALALGAIIGSLPDEVRAKLRKKGTRSLLDGWSLGRSLRLVPLRVVYFSILLVYAAVALEICRIPVDGQVVLSTVPLVLLADGLPSVSGLGTRETTLQLLLKPTRPEVLMAMSLFWTAGLVAGRCVIGLAHLWGHQLLAGTAVVPPASDPTSSV